jgi:hypothetical protein
MSSFAPQLSMLGNVEAMAASRGLVIPYSKGSSSPTILQLFLTFR